MSRHLKNQDYTPSEDLWQLGQAIVDYIKVSCPFEEGDGVYEMSRKADEAASMFMHYGEVCKELCLFYDKAAKEDEESK
jgi:hypothetical protein